MAKNKCGKTRPVKDPYEIWKSFDQSWEWRVLKKYQNPENEAKNDFARWFCAVKSPYTYDGYDMGDVYVHEIKGQAYRFDEAPFDTKENFVEEESDVFREYQNDMYAMEQASTNHSFADY